ncbi:E3 ubiquitin protein ligase UPL1-like protein [Tanacetum coccineum]
MVTTPVNQVPEGTSNNNQHEITNTDDAGQHHEETTQDEGNHQSNLSQSSEQELRIDMDEAENVGFMHEEMEDGGILGASDQIELTFHVESIEGDNTGDEDDDMGDDGEDDEDIAEDGTALMSLADTDVEDHDETGLGDEYNDDMVDEEEDDEYHENRVIEVRWREALDGVLGQPGAADTGLIDIAAEPFEGVNVDDLFGLRRPLAFDRRRRQSRTSFERSSTEGNNSLQHPLLLRPSQSNDSRVIYSSGGVNSSRDLESLSGGSFDVAHFYMFDAPVLPFDHAFGDRVGGVAAPPPLSDFSVGLESLQAPPRKGLGDGRWTDDGQLQAGGQAAAIAQAVAEGADTDTQQTDPNTIHQELNQSVENAEHSGGQSHGPTTDVGNNALDSMEIGEGNESVNEQQELPATDDLNSNHLVNTDNTIITEDADVDMNVVDSEANQGGDALPSVGVAVEPLSEQNTSIAQDDNQTGQSDETDATNSASNANGIDPTFLEALPADLRAEVLASQQAQSVPAPVSAPAPTPAPSTAEEIDPEFLAALPPDIQAEVNFSSPTGLHIQLLDSSVLLDSYSALPSPLLAEAQMLRDRAMSHYQAHTQQSDPNTIHQELNQSVENAQHSGGQSHGPTPDVGNNALDSMEIGEGNESVNEQQELPATDDLASNPSVGVVVQPLSKQTTSIAQDNNQTCQSDETVLASQQAQSVPDPVSAPAPTPVPSAAEEINPEFLAAIPLDIQAQVLAQQRAQRVAHQAQGQPIDMDNASIIATFLADLHKEVLLTSSEAVLSALPSLLLAEAQMIRDISMSHYQVACITIGRRTSSPLLESFKVKEVKGYPVYDSKSICGQTKYEGPKVTKAKRCKVSAAYDKSTKSRG